MLPHAYLHYLHKWPEEFCRRLFGSSRGREDCRKYWEKAHTSSWFAEHPAKTQIDADPLSVVPARLYGDDAAYQKAQRLGADLVIFAEPPTINGISLRDHSTAVDQRCGGDQAAHLQDHLLVI